MNVSTFGQNLLFSYLLDLKSSNPEMLLSSVINLFKGVESCGRFYYWPNSSSMNVAIWLILLYGIQAWGKLFSHLTTSLDIWAVMANKKQVGYTVMSRSVESPPVICQLFISPSDTDSGCSFDQNEKNLRRKVQPVCHLSKKQISVVYVSETWGLL